MKSGQRTVRGTKSIRAWISTTRRQPEHLDFPTSNLIAALCRGRCGLGSPTLAASYLESLAKDPESVRRERRKYAELLETAFPLRRPRRGSLGGGPRARCARGGRRQGRRGLLRAPDGPGGGRRRGTGAERLGRWSTEPPRLRALPPLMTVTGGTSLCRCRAPRNGAADSSHSTWCWTWMGPHISLSSKQCCCVACVL